MLGKKLGDLFVQVSAKGVSGVNKGLEKTDKKATRASKAIDKLKLALVGIGMVGVAAMFKKIIDAAAMYEWQVSKLSQQLKNWNDYSEGNIKLLKEQAQALSKVTTFTEAEIIAGQAMLGSFALTTDQLEQMTPRMLDVAIMTENVTGQMADLATVAKMVGIAMGGQPGQLTRMGIKFSEYERQLWLASNQQEKFNLLLQIFDNNARGLAKSVGTTLRGQLRIVGNQFNSLAKDMGMHLLPVVRAATEVMFGLIEDVKRLNEWIPQLTEEIYDAVLGVDKLTDSYQELNDELDEVIEKHGKYSIETFAKLLELDELIRKEQQKLTSETIDWGKAQKEVNQLFHNFIYMEFPGYRAALNDLTKTTLPSAKEIMESLAKATGGTTEELLEQLEITKEMRDEYRLMLELEGAADERRKILTNTTREMTDAEREWLALQKEIQTIKDRQKAEEEERLRILWESTFFLQGLLTPALHDMADALLSGGEMWKNFATAVVNAIKRIMVQMMAMAALATILNTVFPGMGAAFGGFGGIFKMLMGFQTPGGDMWAYREGRDFGKFFMTGFNERLGAMATNINLAQQPMNVVVHTGDPSTYVEFVSNLPDQYKSKIYRDVTKKAIRLEG